MTSMKKVVVGLALAVTVVMLVRRAFFEGEYLSAEVVPVFRTVC